MAQHLGFSCKDLEDAQRSVTETAEVCVAEVYANQARHMTRLCQLSRPNLVVAIIILARSISSCWALF